MTSQIVQWMIAAQPEAVSDTVTHIVNFARAKVYGEQIMTALRRSPICFEDTVF